MKLGSMSLFSPTEDANGSQRDVGKVSAAIRNCLFVEYLQESLDCYTVNEARSAKVTNASLARSNGPA